MLGRLAKMLRLLGYDTLYSPAVTTAELQAIARRGERIILTRGNAEKRFPGLANVFPVKSDSAPEQLREVVQQFSLETEAHLWSRCTLCNASIQKVEKPEVESLVEPKVFQIYQEFFRCSGCGHVYWRGSHVERILKNLSFILAKR